MHRLKFFIKPRVICILFFAKFGDSLLYSQIYVSDRKIIIGNKRFKVENCLPKRDGGNFSKIAIKAQKEAYGVFVFFFGGMRGAGWMELFENKI